MECVNFRHTIEGVDRSVIVLARDFDSYMEELFIDGYSGELVAERFEYKEGWVIIEKLRNRVPWVLAVCYDRYIAERFLEMFENSRFMDIQIISVDDYDKSRGILNKPKYALVG